jgi:hypothetical protein
MDKQGQLDRHLDERICTVHVWYLSQSAIPTSRRQIRRPDKLGSHSLFVLEFGGLRGVNSLKGVAPDKLRACP